MSIMYDWYRGNSESCYLRSALSSERMLPFSKQMYRETSTASKYNLDENAYDKKMRREMLTENKLDPVCRVTGIPGWYWIRGIKCSDTTRVGLVY